MASVLQAAAVAAAAAAAASSSTQRVEDSVAGLFALWWMFNETNHTGGQPGFLFSCGQIGGTGTTAWNQCVCDHPDQCENCYRWWDAIAIESIANRGIYLHDEAHADKAHTLLEHSPYNSKWPGPCAYIDDFAWYLLAYTRVYTWLKEPAFLQAAEDLHAWLDHKGVDHKCGGVTWQACGPGEGCGCVKNSVTLLEILIGSARLGMILPHKKHYLQTAISLWDFMASISPFDPSTGLIIDGFSPVVPGTKDPGYCCNASADPGPRCQPNLLPGYSYNQGLYLSAAAHLYAATNASHYLVGTSSLVEALLENATDADGVLVEPGSPPSYYYGRCVQGEDPGSDWFSFKGVAVMHLTYFMELAGHRALTKELRRRVKGFLEVNAERVWVNASTTVRQAEDVCFSQLEDDAPPIRDEEEVKVVVVQQQQEEEEDVAVEGGEEWEEDEEEEQMGDEVLDPVVEGAAQPPPPPKHHQYRRFHWRWEHLFEPLPANHTPKPPPPDPAAWFTKQGIRCTGLQDYGTQNTSANCKALCSNDQLCNAFLFAPKSKTGIATGDCWLIHNRTDGHDCSGVDQSFLIGVKRPTHDPTASCAKRHGGCNDTPRNMSDGRQCYCDAACAEQLDCCTDYAEECPSTAGATTCQGDCGAAKARAIPGGGYCWCTDCEPPPLGEGEDDSGAPTSSHCCPDYDAACGSQPKTHICMDARSHGSAVNLFLAALRVEQLT